MNYCSDCGASLPQPPDWPRHCPSCARQHFRNPIPVTVVLIPVDSGVLLIRRAIPPRQGELALPGGFVNWGESWQQAGCREVLEETGLSILPEELRLLEAVSVESGNLLLFALASPRDLSDLNLGFRCAEVEELLIARSPRELAFSAHTRVLNDFLQDNPRRLQKNSRDIAETERLDMPLTGEAPRVTLRTSKAVTTPTTHQEAALLAHWEAKNQGLPADRAGGRVSAPDPSKQGSRPASGAREGAGRIRQPREG